VTSRPSLPFPDRPLLFVGGKGGVGKTTVAAAAALAAARRGQRTLLISTDPAHSTSDILETPLGPDPTPAAPNLWAMEIDPVREADRYITDVKARIAEATPPRLAAEVERQMDIARISPGAEDAALFDRFTRIIDSEGQPFHRLVFDTAPTGHTLRLLTLPESMATWMTGLVQQRRKVNVLGRMWRNVAGAAAGADEPGEDPVLAALETRRRRFKRTRTVLTDPARTAFVFVVIPERLPILETARAAATLTRYDIPVAAIVINRVLPDGAGEFLARRRERERTYLDRIEGEFSAWPQIPIPLQPHDVVGIEALTHIATRLNGVPSAPGAPSEPPARS